MTKKAKKVSFDPSPPTAMTFSHPPVVDQADRIRFKTQSLLQDYVDLVKETQDKKIRLRRAKKKKLNLNAEVIFLRQKYQYFLINHPERFSLLKPQTSHTGVTKPSKAKKHLSQRKPPSRGVVCQTTTLNSDKNDEFHLKEKNYTTMTTAVPSTSGVVVSSQGQTVSLQQRLEHII